MPPGQPYTSPDQLPPEFDIYDEEGKLAALDAYNGAISAGEPVDAAFEAAHTAAKSVTGAQQAGVSDELAGPGRQREVSERVPGPRGRGGSRRGGRGGGAGGGSLASALAGNSPRRA